MDIHHRRVKRTTCTGPPPRLPEWSNTIRKERFLDLRTCYKCDDRVQIQVNIAHNWAHLERGRGPERSTLNVYSDQGRFAASSNVLMKTGKRQEGSEYSHLTRTVAFRFSHDSRPFLINPADKFEDDFEPVPMAEGVELDDDVWACAEQILILDAVLFNTNVNIFLSK